jgi:fructose-1,6-bisphosphatase/sedoheptulose 1,7-bisphosphatase-like protein
MLGWVGVYEPADINFNDTILTGDTLIVVYPNKRYEYMLTHVPHRGTRINLRPEGTVKTAMATEGKTDEP